METDIEAYKRLAFSECFVIADKYFDSFLSPDILDNLKIHLAIFKRDVQTVHDLCFNTSEIDNSYEQVSFLKHAKAFEDTLTEALKANKDQRIDAHRKINDAIYNLDEFYPRQ